MDALTFNRIRAAVGLRFAESLSASFARHIRAIERWLKSRRKIDVLRTEVEFDKELAIGVGRLAILKYECKLLDKEKGREWPAWTQYKLVVVVGVEGIRNTSTVPPQLSDEEALLDPRVRLTLAHELAHVALGHCFRDRNELHIAEDFAADREQDVEAHMYAVALSNLIGQHLRESNLMIANGLKTLPETAMTLWPELREHSEQVLALAASHRCLDLLRGFRRERQSLE